MRGQTEVYSAIVVDELVFAADEFAEVCGVSVEWVCRHVEAGVLPGSGEDPAAWRFGGGEIRRVRRLMALERDFDAPPELAALVIDLQEEIARLRAMIR